MGFIYIAFGKNAATVAGNSLASIRNTGNDFPATSIGDTPVKGTTFIPWLDHRPWTNDETDPDQRFRAGYIKPFLYNLSPYEYTLYLDADTEIKKNIMFGFDLLKEYDICAFHHNTNPKYAIGEVYTRAQKFAKKASFWDSVTDELRYTCDLLGPDTRIVNSGVIFFRKNKLVKDFFQTWYKEWLIYKGWEEQLAFLRAENVCKGLKIHPLSEEWNDKYLKISTIIWHTMGRGSARDLRQE